MSTRFYPSTSTISSIASQPAIASAWEASIAGGVVANVLSLDLTSAGSIGQFKGHVKSVATNPYDVCVYQFISEPLAAGSLAGTFSLNAYALESGGSDANAMLQVVIRVVNGAGTLVRGTAYAGQANTSVVATAGAINQEFDVIKQTSRFMKDVALTTVAIQEGDRIVVELGYRHVTASTPFSAQLILNDFEEYSLDLPLVAGVDATLKRRAWIEFSADLVPIALNPEEYKYMHDGVLLNASPALPFVDITSVEGFDSPEARLQSGEREGVHGSHYSAEFESGRTITLEGFVYASPTALEAYLDTLKQNFRVRKRDHPLFKGTDAGTRMVKAKSLGFRYAKDSQRRLGVVPFQVQLVCADPRIYLPNGTTRTVINIAGGVGWTTTNINVLGNRDTPAELIIEGAVTGLQMTIQSKEGVLYLQYPAAIAANEMVIINTDNRSVLKYTSLDTGAAGSAFTNARGELVGPLMWSNLHAGQNLVSVTATSSTGGKLTVVHTPAWR